jgi:predicted MFS family arabinose efflux permease
VCAVAGSLGVLVAGRTLQGFSVAVIPLAIGTIRDVLPRDRVMTAIGIVSATLGAGGEARIGAAWTLAAGSAITAAAYLWLAIASSQVSDMLIFSVLQGVGFGLAYAALGTVAVQHVPMDQSAIASGINSLVRTTGGSLGAAITATLVTSYLIPRTTLPALHGYVLSFAISAVAATLAAAVAAWHAVRYRAE